MATSEIPDVSTMKLSDLKRELNLYGIDSSVFCEKSEFIAELQNARKTLPRPSTSYKDVAPRDSQEDKVKLRRASSSSKTKPVVKHSSSGLSQGGNSEPNQTPSISSNQSRPTVPPAINNTNSDPVEKSKLLASRSPVTSLQQIREHPSERVISTRSFYFLPGAPFSISLRGSIFELDAAILRIPDGVSLTINTASVERKSMETYLQQKGSIGVSLKISTEENPTLLPVWTFDREKSRSYSVSDLGIRVCGLRTVRLLAFMEMGFRSGASVDVCVFGSVSLDRDKFC